MRTKKINNVTINYPDADTPAYQPQLLYVQVNGYNGDEFQIRATYSSCGVSKTVYYNGVITGSSGRVYLNPTMMRQSGVLTPANWYIATVDLAIQYDSEDITAMTSIGSVRLLRAENWIEGTNAYPWRFWWSQNYLTMGDPLEIEDNYYGRMRWQTNEVAGWETAPQFLIMEGAPFDFYQTPTRRQACAVSDPTVETMATYQGVMLTPFPAGTDMSGYNLIARDIELEDGDLQIDGARQYTDDGNYNLIAKFDQLTLVEYNASANDWRDLHTPPFARYIGVRVNVEVIARGTLFTMSDLVVTRQRIEYVLSTEDPISIGPNLFGMSGAGELLERFPPTTPFFEVKRCEYDGTLYWCNKFGALLSLPYKIVSASGQSRSSSNYYAFDTNDTNALEYSASKNSIILNCVVPERLTPEEMSWARTMWESATFLTTRNTSYSTGTASFEIVEVNNINATFSPKTELSEVSFTIVYKSRADYSALNNV